MEPSVVDPYRPFQLVGPSARSSPRPGGGAGSKRTKGVAPTQGPTPEPTSTSSNGSTSSSYSALAPSSFYAPCPKPDPSTLSAKALGKRAATSVPDLGSARGRKDGPSEAGASKLGGRKLKRRRTEEVAHQSTFSSSLASLPGTPTLPPPSSATPCFPQPCLPPNPSSAPKRTHSLDPTLPSPLDDAPPERPRKKHRRAGEGTSEGRAVSTAVVLETEEKKRSRAGGRFASEMGMNASPELGVGSSAGTDQHLASQTPHLPSPSPSDSPVPSERTSFAVVIPTSKRPRPLTPDDSPPSPPHLPSRHTTAGLAQAGPTTASVAHELPEEPPRKVFPRRSNAIPPTYKPRKLSSRPVASFTTFPSLPTSYSIAPAASTPSASNLPASTSKPTSKPAATTSKPAPSTSKAISSSSKAPKPTSKPLASTSKAVPSTFKPAPPASKPLPSTSKPAVCKVHPAPSTKSTTSTSKPQALPSASTFPRAKPTHTHSKPSALSRPKPLPFVLPKGALVDRPPPTPPPLLSSPLQNPLYHPTLLLGLVRPSPAYSIPAVARPSHAPPSPLKRRTSRTLTQAPLPCELAPLRAHSAGKEDEVDEVERFWDLALRAPEPLELSFETEYCKPKRVRDLKKDGWRIEERGWKLWGWDEGAGRTRNGGVELEERGLGRRWGVADPDWGKEIGAETESESGEEGRSEEDGHGAKEEDGHEEEPGQVEESDEEVVVEQPVVEESEEQLLVADSSGADDDRDVATGSMGSRRPPYPTPTPQPDVRPPPPSPPSPPSPPVEEKSEGFPEEVWAGMMALYAMDDEN